MAKTRLTNAMREKAGNALLDHAVERRNLELRRLEDALAREILAIELGPENMALLAQVPKNWIDGENRVYVNANGWRDFLYFRTFETDENGKVRISVEERIYPIRSVNVEGDLAERVQTYLQAEKGYRETFGQLRAQIGAMIRGFKNVEDLLTKIPELKELCPDLPTMTPTTAVVPMVETVMCAIAGLRGEERDGCCGGNPAVEEKEAA